MTKRNCASSILSSYNIPQNGSVLVYLFVLHSFRYSWSLESLNVKFHFVTQGMIVSFRE